MAKQDGEWRTIKGRHVLIGGDGTVLSGPKELKGKKIGSGKSSSKSSTSKGKTSSKGKSSSSTSSKSKPLTVKERIELEIKEQKKATYKKADVSKLNEIKRLALNEMNSSPKNSAEYNKAKIIWGAAQREIEDRGSIVLSPRKK